MKTKHPVKNLNFYLKQFKKKRFINIFIKIFVRKNYEVLVLDLSKWTCKVVSFTLNKMERDLHHDHPPLIFYSDRLELGWELGFRVSNCVLRTPRPTLCTVD